MTAIRFDHVVPAAPHSGWPAHLTLDVREGAFCVVHTPPALAAPLLRLCAGLLDAERGTVEVLRVADPARLSRREVTSFRRRLGVGLEPGGLISNLPLRMNLIVPILYTGAAELADATEMADEVLRTFGIGQWAGRRPADVPPDVRREAVVARALVRRPELLLLEDPISSVRSGRVRPILELCRERARTVVLTTPEPNGTEYEFADLIVSWDERGLQVNHHEVGID